MIRFVQRGGDPKNALGHDEKNLWTPWRTARAELMRKSATFSPASPNKLVVILQSIFGTRFKVQFKKHLSHPFIILIKV